MGRAHGFSTRKDWYQAFEKYFKEIKLMNTMSYHLLNKKGPFEVWMNEYRGQSRVIQTMFLRKNTFFENHIQYFVEHPEEFSRPIRTSLLDYLFRYCMQVEDSEAVYMAVNMLITYAEKEHDEIAIMKCCYIYAMVYSFLDIHNFAGICISYLERGVRLFEKHYDELDEETKSLGITFYDMKGSILYDNAVVHEGFADYFEIVLKDNLEKGLNNLRGFLKTADMRLDVNAVVPYIESKMIVDFLTMSFLIPVDSITREQANYIIALTKDTYGHKKGMNQLQRFKAELFQIMSTRFESSFDYRACFQKLEHMVNALPKFTVTRKEDYDAEALELLAAMSAAFQALVKEGEYEHTQEIGVKILHKLIALIALFPYEKYLQHVADESSFQDVVPLVRYLSTEEEMIEIVLSLTIYRQLQTAIHTKMVAHAAQIITRNMLEQCPEYFVHTLGYETLEEVTAHKANIIEHISKGAMLHDVGKILCTNIINMQYRKISGVEYETIKYHPVTSGIILNEIPLLSKYHDMAVGHHKSFDGTFGYPADFDKVHSPEKFFIDIITISDSLDAATDPFGRNYAATKTMHKVISELNEQKGTRYSDVIVNFIRKDYKTYEELNRLLTSERESVNKEVHEILQHNMRH